MKKVTGLIFVLILLTSSWCHDVNECDETTAPEINFNFLVGGVVLIEDDLYHNNKISDFLDADFIVVIHKIYCDGTERGPFVEYYSIGEDGRLGRKGISIRGFRMDNTEDSMRLEFFLDVHFLGNYTIPYSMLQKHDNATAYFEFRIESEWSESQEELSLNSLTITN